VTAGAPLLVRRATPADWPAIWAFMREILAAGETFTWDRELPEDAARERWMHRPPGRTVVATTSAGAVVGTAASYPNQGGGGAHVASASFMVDPAHAGTRVGRTLGEHVLTQARADGFRAMQFNAVVETNTRAVALWRSLGLEVLATIPEGFRHPEHGFVGLHVMFRAL
jgi:ribosomal protein S18 acetylase RimI-like enzyme